MITILLFMLDL